MLRLLRDATAGQMSASDIRPPLPGLGGAFEAGGKRSLLGVMPAPSVTLTLRGRPSPPLASLAGEGWEQAAT